VLGAGIRDEEGEGRGVDMGWRGRWWTERTGRLSGCDCGADGRVDDMYGETGRGTDEGGEEGESPGCLLWQLALFLPLPFLLLDTRFCFGTGWFIAYDGN
jgi:hypothetical protein